MIEQQVNYAIVDSENAGHNVHDEPRRTRRNRSASHRDRCASFVTCIYESFSALCVIRNGIPFQFIRRFYRYIVPIGQNRSSNAGYHCSRVATYY